MEIWECWKILLFFFFLFSQLLKEISTLRIEQLDELENIFDYLEDNRNLKDYQGEKSAR